MTAISTIASICCPSAVFPSGIRTLTVVLNKSSTDLGFSLEGGLGSSQGDGPIVIKKVFQGKWEGFTHTEMTSPLSY